MINIKYNSQLLKTIQQDTEEKEMIFLGDNKETETKTEPKGYKDFGEVIDVYLSYKEQKTVELKLWQRFNSALGGGFAEGSLTLVCAKSGFGKTNFLVQLSKLFCEDQENILPHVFVSAELNEADLMERFLAEKMNVPYSYISKHREKYKTEIEEAKELLTVAYPIKFVFSNKIQDVVKVAKQLKAKKNVTYLIIDHIHEMEFDDGGKGTYLDFMKVVKCLYDLYYNHQITIIAAAQFGIDKNTNGAKDFGKRGIDDILFGTALRNPASNIIYIYETKEQYKLKKLINSGKGEEGESRKCQIKLLKVRKGIADFEQTFDYDPALCKFKPSNNSYSL